MVTDSAASALPAVAASIRRKSGRFSTQNSASASSLSKIGTSSQLAKVRTNHVSLVTPHAPVLHSAQRDGGSLLTGIQSPVQFPLIKEPFFRFKSAGAQPPRHPAVGPIHAANSDPARRHSQAEKARLHAKSRRVRQQPNGKRILKGLFNFPLSQRTIQLKGRIVPIELHIEITVNRTLMPMQCLYIVFTHRRCYLSSFLCLFQK